MKRTLPIQICKSFILLLLIVSIDLCGQTLDSTFKSPLPQRAAEIYKIAQQPDGKVILAGDINYFDGKTVSKIIRLNTDGSFDKTLGADLPPDFFPYAMELTSSGNILVHDYTRLFKLGPNGRIKNKIEIQGISSVMPLPNDKVLVSTWSGGLYRYKSNLAVDSTFQNQDFFADGPITDVALQNNRYVICGSFTTVNGVVKNDLARLFPSGAVDNTFDTGSGTDDFLRSIKVHPIDGTIYFTGSTYINSFDGVFGFKGMARLSKNGQIDSLFVPDSQSASTDIFFTAENKIIASGYGWVSRFNYDGSFDYEFNQIVDVPFFVPVIEQLSDGSLLVASLKTIGGDYGIAKFSATGINIPGFYPPISRVGTITSMDRMNKKLVVAGDFFMLNKHHTKNVARLHANGSVDINFRAVNNDGPAFQCAVLPDGKVLLSSFNDVTRLNVNGDVDSTFEYAPFKRLYQVENFHVQADGKIIAGGPNGVYRLNSDGSEDITFDVGTGICCVGYSIFGLDVQASGKPVYGSFFSDFNGTPVNKMVRLNHDASVDVTFDVGTGPNGPINKIEALANDELLVAGWFSDFNGYPTPARLVKLKPDGVLDTTFHSGFVPQSAFFDIKEFGEKILVSGYANGEYVATALSQSGEISTDFTLPGKIVKINNGPKFYVRDNNAFFILGNLTIEGQNRPSLITKIINVPSAEISSQVLSAASYLSGETPVSYRVFPNPAQREIIFNVAQAYDLRITKFSGEIVLKTTVNKDNNTVDISTLAPDNYVIQLISGKKRQTSILVKD